MLCKLSQERDEHTCAENANLRVEGRGWNLAYLGNRQRKRGGADAFTLSKTLSQPHLNRVRVLLTYP